MQVTQIQNRYPTVCAVADHKTLHADLKLAATVTSQDPQELWTQYQAGTFHASELTFSLCVHEFGGWQDGTADELERNLSKIVEALGMATAQKAYRNKLLVKNTTQFTDVRYEIAATAAVLDFLDSGSVRLEPAIGGSARNSDIKGSRQGVTVRFEVRVIHDDWPPKIASGLQAIMEAANIPGDYTVALRFPVKSENEANGVRQLVEELHAKHAAGGITEDKPVSVGTFQFWPEPLYGSYDSADNNCPVTNIGFDTDARIVMPPIFTRAMIDRQERSTVPLGVHVFTGDLTDKRTYRDQPLSTKIAQAIQNKVGQCEDNVCNVVVLGTPSPIVDHDVLDALTGTVAASFIKHADGSFEANRPMRNPTGIFAPADKMEPVVRDNLAIPYRKISAVWHIRLSHGSPRSRVILNPNAAVPLSECDADVLRRTLPFES